MFPPVTSYQQPATNHSAAVNPSPSLQASVLRPPCKASGFTLIELLVVIAIIAILAGLAFPALQGAVNSGKKAQARNDVAQIAAAVKNFQLEYGRLPSTVTGSDKLEDNAAVISALIGSNATLNPRGVLFFEPKVAKGGKSGLDAGVYKDPWGNPYSIMLDTDYDNRIITNNETYFTTVIVSSPGGTDLNDTNKFISNLE